MDYSYQTALLLQLPVELIYMVLDILRPHEKSILAQTCRCLRVIAYSKSVATYDLPDDEAFDYLRCITHNDPGTWVCAFCTQLHAVTEDHLSEEWWNSFAYKNGVFESLVPLWDSSICSDGYRHVQLSLKYDRLSPNSSECGERLARLLTPYNTTPKFPILQSAMRGHIHAVPKVVQGRFILKSTWTFRKGDTILRPDIMGINVHICNHQSFGRTRRTPSTLTKAINMACENQGVTVLGSCGSCQTDFAIEFRSAFVAEVTAWKDFGGEVSPLSDTWRLNLYGVWGLHMKNKQRGRVRNYLELRIVYKVFC
ncbi:unnamed protein product [Clonostachys solani]|uniref:F-box domain-containing protein n=1 Tax=Clonostachys solani TaxID=160281 RepID=A0A9N9Z1S4_9HYPO|nr:unnamed protein product [Clonostachys solani]